MPRACTPLFGALDDAEAGACFLGAADEARDDAIDDIDGEMAKPMPADCAGRANDGGMTRSVGPSCRGSGPPELPGYDGRVNLNEPASGRPVVGLHIAATEALMMPAVAE